MTALSHAQRIGTPAGRARGKRTRAGNPPIEYSLLLTATLCLLAFGAVMVFSASSTTSVLGGSGDGAEYLKRTLLFGGLGLLAMRFLSVRGLRAARALTPLLLAISLALLVVVLVPGVGLEANGARRWLGAGPIQVQPSELAKLALVLYGAHLIAARPKLVRNLRTMSPYLLVAAVACGLIVVEPDLGSALVAGFAVAALLIAGGARLRHLALVTGALAFAVLLAITMEPYRQDRLTSFLDPGADPGGAGFQGIQSAIALGSGGVFGVGLGESVQKAFYLPEAHTDMIAAVIGEELGLLGITVLVGLFALFGYAGFRTAQRARDRYGKLVATGLTALILTQAVVNLFAVLGLAPLTGIPLPFVSYGNSNLLVMLAAVGLMLNVAQGGTASARHRVAAPSKPRAGRRGRKGASARARGARLRVLEGGRASATGHTPDQPVAPRRRSARSSGHGRHSRGRNSRARRAGARRRGRTAG
jgi:cell division protein FtsW